MTGVQSTITSVKQYTESLQTDATHKIIMVASGKGGVGKTWFSISMAQALAQAGQKVLLFDGDLGLANVDIQLGLMPDKDLGTFLEGQATFEEVIVRYEVGQFDIIAGRSGCGALSSLSSERLTYLQQSLKNLASRYDSVIMDLGAGVGGTVRSLSRIADECLIIVTDEPTSLTDAYAFMKVTHTHQPELPQSIVVNQVDSQQAGEGVYETLKNACFNFLQFTPAFAGAIRRDSLVRDAIRNQSPLLTRHGQAAAAKDIHNIIKNLTSKKMASANEG